MLELSGNTNENLHSPNFGSKQTTNAK